MNITFLLVTLWCLIKAHCTSAIAEDPGGSWGPSPSSKCKVVKSKGKKWFELTSHRGYEDVLYTVNCTMLNLRHIPVPLPVKVDRISHLFLEKNKIKRFPGYIFENFTNLVYLDISQDYTEVEYLSSYLFSGVNNLKMLRMSHLGCINGIWGEPIKFDKPEQVFSPMVNLKFLNIGDTCYDIPNLTNALRHVSSTLTTLMMNKVFWKSLTKPIWTVDKSFTQCLAHTRLKELYMEDNKIVEVKHGSFYLLPHLEKLSVRRNHLFGDVVSLIELILLVNLTKFDMGRNYRDMHSRNGKVYWKQYQSGFYGEESNVKNTVNFNLPFTYLETLEKLKVLRIDNIIERTVQINFDKYKICWKNQLEYLDVSHSYVQNVIGTALCMFKLKHLKMKYFYTDYFDSKFFEQMPSLEKLDLQGSSGEVIFKNESASTIFRNNRELQILSLSQCNIQKIPLSIFQWTNKLRRLDLSRNRFKYILFDISKLTELQYLDISHNSIDVLNNTFLKDLNNIAKLQGGGLQLNIEGNPLFCGCVNKNTLDNLLKPAAAFDIVGFMNGTHRPTCILSNRKEVPLYEGIKHLQNECATYVELVTLTFIYPFTLVTMLVSSVLYR